MHITGKQRPNAAETCAGPALSASRLFQQALQLPGALKLLDLQIRPHALAFSITKHPSVK